MMAATAITASRLSLRAVGKSGSGIAVARALAPPPSMRAFHASHRRRQDEASSRAGSSPASGSSSSSSSSSNGPSLSIINILLATAVVVLATPHALELYGTISGTTPLRSTPSSIPGKFESHTHRPLPLISSAYYPDTNTASVHKLLRIGLPASIVASGGSDGDKLKKMLRIRSVYIKEPSLMIERAYTPLYDTLPGSCSAALDAASGEEKQRLELLVKRYPDGELSRMLHRAVANPTVPQLEVRGPMATWSFERDSEGEIPERIVMVVGGTGITPAYQLLTNLFGRPATSAVQPELSKVPKIDVLYATPNLENALLLPQLHTLVEAHKDKVSVSLFAERLAGSLSPSDRSALGPQLTASSGSAASFGRSWLSSLFGKSSSKLDAKLQITSLSGSVTGIPVFESRITQQHLERVLLSGTGSGRTLVLVSGPDGMVEAIAGPKSRDGRTQGSLSGVLAALGCRQQDVFKL